MKDLIKKSQPPDLKEKRRESRKRNDEIVNLFLDISDGNLFTRYSLRPKRYWGKKHILSDRSRLVQFYNENFEDLSDWQSFIEFAFEKWTKSKFGINSLIGYVCSDKVFDWWKEKCRSQVH